MRAFKVAIVGLIVAVIGVAMAADDFVTVRLPRKLVNSVLDSIGQEEGLLEVPSGELRILIRELKASVGRTTPPDDIYDLKPPPEY